MKHIRLFVLAVLLAGLGACSTTQWDLKSPCACEDGIKPRINQTG